MMNEARETSNSRLADAIDDAQDRIRQSWQDAVDSERARGRELAGWGISALLRGLTTALHTERQVPPGRDDTAVRYCHHRGAANLERMAQLALGHRRALERIVTEQLEQQGVLSEQQREVIREGCDEVVARKLARTFARELCGEVISRDQRISTCIHELRTPLSAIAISVDLALTEPDEKQQARALARVQRNIRRLIEITDRMQAGNGAAASDSPRRSPAARRAAHLAR